MKRKITLEEISLFLPYELSIKILNHKSDYVGIEVSHITGFYMLGDSPHFDYEGGSTGKSLSEFKPIVWPLNQFRGVTDRFVSQDADEIEEAINDGTLEFIRHDLFMMLVEEHVDVFGWLDDDLAIDMNDVNFEKYETK